MKSTVRKRELSVKVMTSRDDRVARMESYVQKTHGLFLKNLEMAEQMRVMSNGVLAGPVVKRAKARNLGIAY